MKNNELKEYSAGALSLAKKLFPINRSISNIGVKKLIYVKKYKKCNRKGLYIFTAANNY